MSERSIGCIELIATVVQARLNCQASGNTEWLERHTDRLAQIEKDLLPSGSGIDSGTGIDLDASTGDRIVLTTAFHHMNDGGYYDGWTEHTITIRPSFIGRMSITIGGQNRNQIKDYLHDLFGDVLGRTVVESAETVRFA